jgi:hypothetical protein
VVVRTWQDARSSENGRGLFPSARAAVCISLPLCLTHHLRIVAGRDMIHNFSEPSASGEWMGIELRDLGHLPDWNRP